MKTVSGGMAMKFAASHGQNSHFGILIVEDHGMYVTEVVLATLAELRMNRISSDTGEQQRSDRDDPVSPAPAVRGLRGSERAQGRPPESEAPQPVMPTAATD